MNERKKEIEAALNSYFKKQLPRKTRRKNSSPEKEVQNECLKWLKQNGFSVDIIEVSTYDARLKRNITKKMKSGICDCIGNNSEGYAVFIEFKAKGRLSTLKEHQKQFLLKKINSNAFACCVDSKERLEEIYEKWFSLRKKGYFALCNKILIDYLNREN